MTAAAAAAACGRCRRSLQQVPLPEAVFARATIAALPTSHETTCCLLRPARRCWPVVARLSLPTCSQPPAARPPSTSNAAERCNEGSAVKIIHDHDG